MPLRQLESLFKNPVKRSFDKGQVLLYAGDDLHNVFFIKKGYVKMYAISDDGEQRILLIFQPNSAFPVFPGVLGSKPYKVRYFYEAMTNTEVYMVPKTQFGKLLDTNEQAARLVLDYITELAGDLVRRLSTIENKNAKNKIAHLMHYLLKTCAKEFKAGYWRLSLKITHQDIANMSGLTRETASTQLKSLEEDGVIQQNRSGRLVINQSKLDA